MHDRQKHKSELQGYYVIGGICLASIHQFFHNLVIMENILEEKESDAVDLMSYYWV